MHHDLYIYVRIRLHAFYILQQELNGNKPQVIIPITPIKLHNLFIYSTLRIKI